MVERMVWNGRKYRRYPQSRHEASRRYFQRTFAGGSALLHRDVWAFHHGPIADGMEVHHVDGDPGNNDIGNLELVTRAEHVARHPWAIERVERQREHLERIRPLTKEWHGSEAGRDEHRRIGALSYAGFKPKRKRCDQCREWFTPAKIGSVDRFCSNKCKSAWRRASGVDDEQRQCAHCGVVFACNRYRKQRACSRACGNSLRGATLRSRL